MLMPESFASREQVGNGNQHAWSSERVGHRRTVAGRHRIVNVVEPMRHPPIWRDAGG
jgi:hypothetical protein